MKIAAILFILICWFSIGHSLIINVPEDYSTIQEGIDASIDGDTVLVWPGTYNEHTYFNGKSILLCSRRGPDSTIVRSVHIGGGLNITACLRGFTVYTHSWPYLVAAASTASALIEGNIIRGN